MNINLDEKEINILIYAVNDKIDHLNKTIPLSDYNTELKLHSLMSFHKVLDKLTERKLNLTTLNTLPADQVYQDEGIAIYVKGQMVIGIHPDNVQNNLEHLISGNMKIDWKSIKQNLDKQEEKQMNIYLLKRPEDEVEYDEFAGFVVRAQNEEAAVTLISEEYTMDRQGSNDYVSDHYTYDFEITLIGTGVGEPAILLTDYKAG